MTLWKIFQWFMFIGIMSGIFNTVSDGELSYRIITLPFMCLMMWYGYYAELPLSEKREP